MALVDINPLTVAVDRSLFGPQGRRWIERKLPEVTSNMTFIMVSGFGACLLMFGICTDYQRFGFVGGLGCLPKHIAAATLVHLLAKLLRWHITQVVQGSFMPDDRPNLVTRWAVAAAAATRDYARQHTPAGGGGSGGSGGGEGATTRITGRGSARAPPASTNSLTIIHGTYDSPYRRTRQRSGSASTDADAPTTAEDAPRAFIYSRKSKIVDASAPPQPLTAALDESYTEPAPLDSTRDGGSTSAQQRRGGLSPLRGEQGGETPRSAEGGAFDEPAAVRPGDLVTEVVSEAPGAPQAALDPQAEHHRAPKPPVADSPTLATARRRRRRHGGIERGRSEGGLDLQPYLFTRATAHELMDSLFFMRVVDDDSWVYVEHDLYQPQEGAGLGWAMNLFHRGYKVGVRYAGDVDPHDANRMLFQCEPGRASGHVWLRSRGTNTLLFMLGLRKPRTLVAWDREVPGGDWEDMRIEWCPEHNGHVVISCKRAGGYLQWTGDRFGHVDERDCASRFMLQGVR
ncbi:hypothetical protein JKP88DRAFT_266699 [Tribonema minus]|uniref:Uncharacterized protein n=1 Tax=Tribonema minus TaxID=303371 RepID=A0A835ZHV2_9STRA|nr:hypothetical protein JKP88DRAFT_266699 [Tribonema minus]